MEKLNEDSLSIKFGNEVFSLRFLNGIQGVNCLVKPNTTPNFKYRDFKRENGKWSTTIKA